MNQPELIQLSRNPIKLLIWFVIALGCIWLVWNTFATVLVFSIAALIAYLVTPAVSWLSSQKVPYTSRKIPWGVSVLVVYFFITGIFSLLILLFAPLAIAQAGTLASSAPGYFKSAETSLDKLHIWYKRLHVSPAVETDLERFGTLVLEKTSPVLSSFAANVAADVLKLFSALFVFLAAFLVSLYIVLDLKNIKAHFLDMFPQAWKKDTQELTKNVGRVVGAFIRGQILLSLLVGTASYLALLLVKAFGIGYDYALLTALVAGLSYPIPFIGVWAPRLLAPVLAFFQLGGWTAALSVFLALTSVGLAVDNAALPVVMGKGVGISPLMVLLVVFAGGELFGVWGLILAVPAAAVIRLIFFYLQKHFTI